MASFEEQFLYYVDNIAPKLGTNQQTVYLYMVAKALRAASNEIVVSIKRERELMGFGTGISTSPMSETTVTECVRVLEGHGLCKRIETMRQGSRLAITLPLQAVQFAPILQIDLPRRLEEIDFFLEPLARNSILAGC